MIAVAVSTLPWLTIFLGFTYFVLPMSSSLKSIGVVAFLLLSLIHPTKAYTLFKKPFGLATLGFVGMILLASCWSVAPFSVAFSLFTKYAKYLLLPFFVAALGRYRLEMLKLTIAGVFCASVLSIVFHSDSLFRNHIIFGLMEAVAIYLCAYFAIRPAAPPCLCEARSAEAIHPHLTRILYLTIAFILLFQLYWINGGRMAYLITFVLGVLWVFQFCSRRFVLIALCSWVLGAGCIFMLSSVMQNRVQHAVAEWQDKTPETSVGYRLQFHQYAKQLFLRHPLIGNGTGSYQVLVQQEQQFPNWQDDPLREPHSQYWLILAEQGIMGFLVMLIWLFSLFWTTFRLKETGPIACAMLIALCLSQLSDSMLMYSGPGYFFMMVIAICLGEAYENTV